MEQETQLDSRTFPMMKRLIKESVRPYTKQITIALFFMVVSSASAAASMALLKPVINDIFVDKNIDLLWPIGTAIIFVFLIKGLSQYGQATIMSWLGLRIVTDMQVRLYDHIMTMDLQFFHDRTSNELVSRVTNDTSLIRNTTTKALVSLGKDSTQLIGMVVVMVWTNWQLALFALIVFPITLGPVIRIGRRIRKVSSNTQEQIAVFMTLLSQTFGGIRHVKAYRMENYERTRVREMTETIRKLIFKSERTKAINSPLMEAVSGFAIALIVIYGGYQVIDEVKTPGDFFAFLGAALMVYEPAKRLANLNADMQTGLAGAERIFRILGLKANIKTKPDAPKLNVTGGELLFKNIEFSYNDETEALKDLNIHVEAGKTVALVGPSGAGKSTVLNLVPRFYDVNGGAVEIDGVDIRDACLASLRRSCALVSQEIVLFDDSIRANIAYGKLNATEEEIIQAAQHAAAHEFIMALPDGYDTIVGENGVKLSGGQRQRVSIARAMLKNAPILLLDEATSALDTESERNVQEALQELMKDRTTLVIAHRLSTVVDADKIYVIDQGTVMEEGSHAELIEQDGIYARLYSMQFTEDQEAAVPA